MSYKILADRGQINLFPFCLDDSIAPDNIVRVIDAFVNWLDLSCLHRERQTESGTGINCRLYFQFNLYRKSNKPNS